MLLHCCHAVAPFIVGERLVVIGDQIWRGIDAEIEHGIAPSDRRPDQRL